MQLFDNVREAYLRAALYQHGGSVSKAAKELQVSRATLYRWMKRYGIEHDAYRS